MSTEVTRRVETKTLNLGDDNAVVPYEFGFESEHPALTLPFNLYVCGQNFTGAKISITTVRVKSRDDVFLLKGKCHSVKLQFEFQNFSLAIYPDVIVVGEYKDELILQFANPTGEHLAQLRFVLNSFIAGDFVTLGSVMAYSGPTKPKEDKAPVEQNWKDRVRSIAVAAMSAGLIIVAAAGLYSRFTTAIEMHPVLIDQAGQTMRASAAGQVAYLNPEAAKGEILFSVNSNSGDVLNFQMPCDCEVVVNQGIGEGTTVLPTDVILTILVNSLEVNIQALMSVEGLARAMKGDAVFLDMADGRSIPVNVVAGQTSNNAALSGELFMPVQLTAAEGALGQNDIGKFAQLRLKKKPFWAFGGEEG